ncbi:MAG: efflux RND transporter periplasmic adaptor subunit [Monoglobaceae bacterium]
MEQKEKVNIFSKAFGTVCRGVKKVFGGIFVFAKKHKVLSIVIIAVLVVAVVFSVIKIRAAKKTDTTANTEVTASRMTISESITGSSVVEANNEYSVVPLVTGEILTANFEEGDFVTKDQVLYEIDASSVEPSVKSADLAIEKAQIAYNKALSSHTDDIADKTRESNDLSLQKAQNSYNEALDNAGKLTVSSDVSGTVSEVYISVGDTVANGTKIAEVVDNDKLKVRVPFNASDADNIYSGESAEVCMQDSGMTLYGVVTSVSSGSETTDTGMRIKYVTIEVSNPGSILEGDSATAMAGGYACNDAGTFEAADKRTVIAEVSGDITYVPVVKGDYVLSGSALAYIDSTSVDSQTRDAEIALREARLKQESAKLEEMDSDDYAAKLKSARLSLDDALLQKEKLQSQLDDYTITSPIDGTVVTKNKKAGDKIEGGSGGSSSASSSSSSNILAVIYDMSSLCFQLDIDELDVKKVEVGQEVVITADAAEGKTYTGVVENVSVNGTIGTNGVTTYPVKVRITDADDQLLPGMNIDAEITVEQAENVIAVPINAVNRGNTVYVKGEKTDDSDKAPEGFKTVSVETGISNDMYVEIKSGISENDTVYVTAPSGSSEQNGMMPGMGGMPGGMGGGMPGGGMGGGMPGGGGGGNRSGGGMPGGGGR